MPRVTAIRPLGRNGRKVAVALENGETFTVLASVVREHGLLAGQELAPEGPDYRHHRTGEDNGDAHLKRQLLGHQVTMAVTDGRLNLGNWEQIHYAEFDGRRRKRIMVKVVGVL